MRDPTEDVPGWLPFAFFFSLCVLAAAFLGFLARSKGTKEKAGFPFTEHRVNLNRAEEGELILLPGIGPRLAEAIVKYRRIHGPFRDLHALEAVKGLGTRKVNAFASWVTLGDGDTRPGAPPPSRSREKVP